MAKDPVKLFSLRRLIYAALLSMVGLILGISLPQFLPREAQGEPCVIPYDIIHLVIMTLSICLPYFTSLWRGWPLSHRIGGVIFAGMTVTFFWLVLGWGRVAANSWQRLW